MYVVKRKEKYKIYGRTKPNPFKNKPRSRETNQPNLNFGRLNLFRAKSKLITRDKTLN